MRVNSNDQTLKKNYIQKYQFLIAEYEAVKCKKHPKFRFAKEFYKAFGVCPQTFLKYYNRYKQSDNPESLIPKKRGPAYLSRRCDIVIEKEILDIRAKGCNKYEIHDILKEKFAEKALSPSGIYKVLRRNNMNKLTHEQETEKRQIIKERAGELGHIDCHHLSKDLVAQGKDRYYLVCVIDDQSRIAWAELVSDIKSLTVMFATLRCFNYIKRYFDIEFEEVLTDNGPEFGIKTSTKKGEHPFERMLIEMGIKHRYTRPYRPQTNGKVERFWRTLNEDLIEGTYFEDIHHFKDELEKYLVYYNELRPHQGLNGKKPKDAIKK